jgi:hypothetical protein
MKNIVGPHEKSNGQPSAPTQAEYPKINDTPKLEK